MGSFEEPVLFAGILDTGKTKKRKVSKRVDGYSGNRLSSTRPYDFFPDPRVPVRFFQKGEFCAARVELGWNTILKRTQQGYYIEQVVSELGKRRGGYESDSFGQNRVEGSDQIQLPEHTAYYLSLIHISEPTRPY